MKRLTPLILGLLILLTGCAQTSAPSSLVAPSQPRLNIDELSFFLTYMSEQANLRCAQDQHQCSDDPISAAQWFAQLSTFNVPLKPSNAQSKSDYELLVASQRRTTQLVGSNRRVQKAVSIDAEFTVQWRGFALDTFKTTVALDSEAAAANSIGNLSSQWLTHAHSQGVFDTDFLYQALNASDYQQGLSVPSNLGDFYLEATQLYADPFQGVVSRYRHPKFANAILDITVSPILTVLSQANDEWMRSMLAKELARAESVANNQSLELVVDVPITALNLSPLSGHYFSVHAFDEFEEPLYAATYLFKRKDKLVMFTSSFPHDIAEPLVIEAMKTLDVPAESALMTDIRALL